MKAICTRVRHYQRRYHRADSFAGYGRRIGRLPIHINFDTPAMIAPMDPALREEIRLHCHMLNETDQQIIRAFGVPPSIFYDGEGNFRKEPPQAEMGASPVKDIFAEYMRLKALEEKTAAALGVHEDEIESEGLPRVNALEKAIEKLKTENKSLFGQNQALTLENFTLFSQRNNLFEDAERLACWLEVYEELSRKEGRGGLVEAAEALKIHQWHKKSFTDSLDEKGSVSVEQKRREFERMEMALEEIKLWAKAYPVDIFPEPDMARVRELLEAGGVTLDCVSASGMRLVVAEVAKIAREGLGKKEEENQ